MMKYELEDIIVFVNKEIERKAKIIEVRRNISDGHYYYGIEYLSSGKKNYVWIDESDIIGLYKECTYLKHELLGLLEFYTKEEILREVKYIYKADV